MFDDSRIDIYEYLYDLFHGAVTNNVYSMGEPLELTPSDTEEGFMVLYVGNVGDASEFDRAVYGEARCFVEAFIPPISRGRLDYDKYKAFEDAINSVIDLASQESDGKYQVLKETVISMDAVESSTADNTYFTFIKSFIVTIHNQ